MRRGSEQVDAQRSFVDQLGPEAETVGESQAGRLGTAQGGRHLRRDECDELAHGRADSTEA